MQPILRLLLILSLTIGVGLGAADTPEFIPVKRLEKLNPAASDSFGTSVAVSGDLLVVGTPGDQTAGMEAGAVYVFHTGTGALLRTLMSPKPADREMFGRTVAASGHLVVVSGASAIYLFDGPSG